jgi:prepilin-type N-terminal cleavage/methylation domain-containing protein
VNERPGSPAPRRGALRGFTILELLIVLALVTVTAAVSIWAYFSRPEVTLDNAALLLARDLRIAQTRALLFRRPVSLVFSPDGEGYRIVDETGSAGFSRPAFERVERRYARDAIFQGVRILPLGLAAAGRVVFPGDGSEPPTGRLTLSYGDETRSLEIESGTGRVLVTDRITGVPRPGN